MGNGAYPEQWFLSNPVNDANAIRNVLRDRLEFDKVIYRADADKRTLGRLIQEFGKSLKNGDTGLFYFSGHGFKGKDEEGNDTNYLVSLFRQRVDVLAALEEVSVRAKFVLRTMRRANPDGVNLMILDSCRDLPADLLEESKSMDSPGGLTAMTAPSGFLIAYATALGKTAFGSKDRLYSIYTGHLLAVLKDRSFWNRNITEVLNETGFRVKEDTDGDQVPWVSSSPVKFCFGGCGASISPGFGMGKLLETCETHFKANRLTSGRGGTALACYEEVLKQERTNAQALDGLRRIEEKYAAWVKQALQGNRRAKARGYLDSLRKVNPESLLLAQLETELEEPVPTYLAPVLPGGGTAIAEGTFRDRLRAGSADGPSAKRRFSHGRHSGQRRKW
ncbi:MAG: caspase family protein [Gammaproteobacteria bacterium]|nr:caspase family protein [Gammaproteobacteria bacterium]